MSTDKDDPRTNSEAGRLAALPRYEILDTPPEESFDAIVRMAAKICNTPVSLITLVDEARQWLKPASDSTCSKRIER